jgi:uncharacterized protein
MKDIELIEYKEIDLSNSMLVVAFPTVGLISSIAGRFIIDSLKLDEMGAIISRYFMPATVIHNSYPSPPVRIYAGKKTCGLNGSCDQLVVIISEFMPPWDIVKPLVDEIFNWAKKKGCKIIVTLEGTNAIDAKKLNVFGIGSTPKMKDILKKYNIEEVKEGMITGDSGVLLYEGARLKRDVICLLAEAHASYPDSRAAGLLLEKLDKILPEMKIDPEPLYKKAEEIENRIRAFMKQSKPSAPTVSQLPSQMYG